jgi:phosphoglycerate dehydrogenase-like enzyme
MTTVGRGNFRIAITGDFIDAGGRLYFDEEALSGLRGAPGASLDLLDTPVGAPLTAGVLEAYDAIIAKRSPLAPDALRSSRLRAIHISRNGVGVEHLDLCACSDAGLMVTCTPDSVRRTMASSAMCLMLALAHRLLEKDRATREGRWSDRHLYQGIGLGGRTLGVVGAGNIGSDLLELAAPWKMKRIVAHPSRSVAEIAELDAEKVELTELLARSDFVVLCCPLNAATHHMIDANALSQMKPDAFLINVGRGGLIDEGALVAALQRGQIRGAGLDVFEREPPSTENPLFGMPQVIVASHNLGFSDEGNRLGNVQAARAVLDVLRGEIPRHLVNPGVIRHPRLMRRLHEAALWQE